VTISSWLGACWRGVELDSGRIGRGRRIQVPVFGESATAGRVDYILFLYSCRRAAVTGESCYWSGAWGVFSCVQGKEQDAWGGEPAPSSSLPCRRATRGDHSVYRCWIMWPRERPLSGVEIGLGGGGEGVLGDIGGVLLWRLGPFLVVSSWLPIFGVFRAVSGVLLSIGYSMHALVVDTCGYSRFWQM
jgi:hypothetical protein